MKPVLKGWLKLMLFSSFFAVATVGCDGCRPVSGNRAKGEVRVIYTDPVTNTQMSGDNGVYDFGTVSMGKTVTQKMTVQNVGLGNLTVQKWSKTSGDAAKVGTFVDEPSPVFTIAFDGETVINSGDSKEFEITFAPPVKENVNQFQHETVLVMTSGDVEIGKENAVITLRGTAVSGECDLPMSIDFGAVQRGDSLNITFDYTNARPIDTHGYLGAVESQQGDGIFVISPDSPKGEFLLPAMRTKTATFTFKPTEERDYIATVRMRRADGCPEKPVRLIGTGVDAVLKWTPAIVDFGYAPPNTLVPGEVTFQNRALRPTTLTMVATREGTNPSNVFKVTMTDSSDLTKVTIPAGARDPMTNMIMPGTQVVKLSFKPVVLGPRQGQLVANTEFMGQPTVSVTLRGVGGGPDIDARPSPTLNFGRIAYFANATPPSYANRKITVQNVGTRPTPADPRANLKLGQSDGAGGFVKPYWEVTAMAGSDLSEICVGVFDAMTNTCTNDLPTAGAGRYDPVQGLEAGGATSLLDIPVRVTPNGLGMRAFTVKIFSNDPDEPVTTINVTANSVVLPPCDVEIVPIALQFGIVSPPSVKDLGFSIRNRLMDVCLMSNLQLLPESGTPAGMPAVFSLPGGPIDELELMGGETKQIMVRAWPQGMLPPFPAQVTGKVGFNLADPVAPSREVALTATIASSCLTISPNTLNFGTVKKDCNSPSRDFQIYNSCSTDVVINSSQLTAAAGEGPGGPNCPGTSPCPEFFVTTGIANGTRVTAGSTVPIGFSLKYHPINYGPDTGAFVISVTQNGQPLDYVVALQGNGDNQGLNTDTFRQDTKPKADILLVIDDSCSMGDKQTQLAQNMAAFLQYATSNQVDFQIGVTNTELSDTERGKLCTGSASGFNPCPHTSAARPPSMGILRPTTPNLATQFAALVNVGTWGGSESCMEPATRALTAPYITDPTANAGFLRNDAVLAVVCVTDARDQAPQAPVFYLNQLINIKGAQRASQFTYNVVGPFLPSAPANCSYDDPNDGRHDFMVSQTNGVKEEICTPNWATSLERIGKNAFGYRTNFFLTSRPDLAAGPIQVAIDGMAIPAVDPNPLTMSRIWTYEPTTNSVNFEPLYVPEPGKTLTITYIAECL
ncbi:MAG: choice-of-anchor D domain-containing protein [Myxococcaceae bacterium]